MISVITPLSKSGNPYIEAVYESLCKQTETEWEWIVLENHGGVFTDGDEDKRVHVFQSDKEGIGALKKEACSYAKGDIIVELDHDDLLTPDALELIKRAFEDGADFVYSNFAEFHSDTWAPNVYSKDFGWQSRPFEYEGHELVEMLAPPPTPQNMRLVDWAPNHVRAWTKKAYDEVGGHDETFQVIDDHDLVTRFYLAGKRFMRINKCLYLYRVHEQNNVKTQNERIRDLTWGVYNKTIWAMAEKWSRDNRLSLIDLCGGVDCPAGYTPVDLHGPGIICDLNKTWKIPESSVGLLRAFDAIEHLKDPIHTMNEAYRVLAPGGFLMIHVPSTNGLGAFCDPTHVSFWNKLSFRYYTDKRFSRYLHDYRGRFQVVRVIEWFPSEWHRENNVPYIEANLIALKPGYEPMGDVLI